MKALVFVGLAAAGLAIQGLVLMILAHLLHSQWPIVPAFSFWHSALIGLAVGLVFGPKW